MQTKNVLLVTSLAGIAFSGYQSAVKFFSQTCALNECPYFWGYPACYFGFGLFLTLGLLASFAVMSRPVSRTALWGVLLVSALGILFAGRFTILELPVLFARGFGAYVLGLPTCAWGLLMFMGAFTCAARLIVKKT